MSGMKKAVVTGASGFIGKALVRELLNQGWTVWAVVRSPNKLADLAQERLMCVRAELTEYAALPERICERGFDAFFHLAWDGTFGVSFRDYHRQLHNAAYAADALTAAVELDAKRFIFTGTIVELEAKHYMITDGGAPRTSCIYGTAKAAAEMICRTVAYEKRLPMNTAILASVYGDGDESGMIQNVLIRALQKGESPKLVSGENLYDWIYVEDVVRGLISIAEQGAVDKTYYVGHRQLQTFESLVTRTRDVVAPEVPLAFGTLEDRTVTDYTLIDREALYRDTGFECQADFDESIRKTANWLKARDKEEHENMNDRSTVVNNPTGGGKL